MVGAHSLLFFFFVLFVVKTNCLKFHHTGNLYVRQFIKSPDLHTGGEKNIVLFVHGLLSSSNTYDEWTKMIYEQLLKTGLSHFYMLGIDTPGHGNSYRPEKDKSIVDLDYITCANSIISNIESIFESVRLNEEFHMSSVHLVGHSTGGKICCAIALQAPTLVASLTLLDVTPTSFLNKHWSPIRQTIRSISGISMENMRSRQDILTELQAFRMSTKLRSFLSSSAISRGPNFGNNSLGTNASIHRLQKSVKPTLSWNFDIESIVASEMSIQSFPKPNEFTHQYYKGPVLLLRADSNKSFYVSDEDVLATYRLFPEANVIDVEAGHWLHSEASRITSFHVAEFIANVLTSSNKHKCREEKELIG